MRLQAKYNFTQMQVKVRIIKFEFFIKVYSFYGTSTALYHFDNHHYSGTNQAAYIFRTDFILKFRFINLMRFAANSQLEGIMIEQAGN